MERLPTIIIYQRPPISHRITILDMTGNHSDTRTFSIICPKVSCADLKTHLQKLCKTRVRRVLEPKVTFLDDAVVKFTHNILIQHTTCGEKSCSFRVRFPSRTSEEVANAIQQFINS